MVLDANFQHTFQDKQVSKFYQPRLKTLDKHYNICDTCMHASTDFLCTDSS
jgi:hypothetical protein